jgi:hypothetical protein
MGMMGTAGGIGGILFAQLLGVVIRQFGYPYAFALAAVLHPAAALILVTILREPKNLAGDLTASFQERTR